MIRRTGCHLSSPLPSGYDVCEHDADSLNHRIDKQAGLAAAQKEVHRKANVQQPFA
jgi:hypothetical protein